MNRDQKREHVTREMILELLSEAELARVSRAEDAPRLVEGDEYVDLQNLAAGVQQVHTPSPDAKHALPRSAVQESTWARIVRAVAR